MHFKTEISQGDLEKSISQNHALLEAQMEATKTLGEAEASKEPAPEQSLTAAVTDETSDRLETNEKGQMESRRSTESCAQSQEVQFLSEIQAEGVNRTSGKLSLVFHVTPEAHQSPGVAVVNGRPHFYLTKAAKSYRAKLHQTLKESYPLFFESNKETTLIPSNVLVCVDKVSDPVL